MIFGIEQLAPATADDPPWSTIVLARRSNCELAIIAQGLLRESTFAVDENGVVLPVRIRTAGGNSIQSTADFGVDRRIVLNLVG